MPDEENEKADADKLKQRNRELAILNTVAKEMNRSVDLDQALRTALAQVAELFGLETGWVWLLEGSLKLESSPGKGTRIEVVIPLETGA